MGRPRWRGRHVLAARAHRDQEPRVGNACIVVCDGLTGLPDAISTAWPRAVTQTCIVHVLHNSFRYASRRDWAAIAKDLRPICTAAPEAAAHDRLAEFAELGGSLPGGS
jgi:putative transposase